FQARHHPSQYVVALKVLQPATLSPAVSQEIEAARTLAHPNVATIHDAGCDGDAVYVAMQYLEGASLREVIHRRGGVPVAAACPWVRQAALALQHAHERGLVHGRLEPGKLFL